MHRSCVRHFPSSFFSNQYRPQWASPNPWVRRVCCQQLSPISPVDMQKGWLYQQRLQNCHSTKKPPCALFSSGNSRGLQNTLIHTSWSEQKRTQKEFKMFMELFFFLWTQRQIRDLVEVRPDPPKWNKRTSGCESHTLLIFSEPLLCLLCECGSTGDFRELVASVVTSSLRKNTFVRHKPQTDSSVDKEKWHSHNSVSRMESQLVLRQGTHNPVRICDTFTVLCPSSKPALKQHYESLARNKGTVNRLWIVCVCLCVCLCVCVWGVRVCRIVTPQKQVLVDSVLMTTKSRCVVEDGMERTLTRKACEIRKFLVWHSLMWSFRVKSLFFWLGPFKRCFWLVPEQKHAQTVSCARNCLMRGDHHWLKDWANFMSLEISARPLVLNWWKLMLRFWNNKKYSILKTGKYLCWAWQTFCSLPSLT